MTSHYDYLLDKREFSVGKLPINIYCARSNCNVYMSKGEAVKKYDAATFTHINCPGGKAKHMAAHKVPPPRWNLGEGQVVEED